MAGRSSSRRSASNTSYIPGFYRTLHTANDQQLSSTLSTLQLGSGDMPEGCFLVESLISERKFKVSIIILCSISWLRERPNTWYCGMATLRKRLPGLLLRMSQQQQSGNTFVQIKSLVSHITVHCRSFESPSPLHRVVADASSNFVATVERSLKAGIHCNCKIEVEFRADVFRYLFSNRGRKPPTGRGLFYYLADFDKTYFRDNWYIV